MQSGIWRIISTSYRRVNISNWDKDLSYDILLNNVTVFCFYPSNVPEAKLKGNILNQSRKL